MKNILKPIQIFLSGHKRRISIVAYTVSLFPMFGETVQIISIFAALLFGGSDMIGLVFSKIKSK
jgi:hypothetical protein